ncbi:MAG TPA: type II toxin-antitoxin system death-on-curing family toxin [Stellaceae bacterium]|nr:type II toxin-antitoxin system death-on-curing family toxin [Stellaceae bacterium]
MPSEPHWVPLEAVIAVNREVVAATGEPHAVQNRKALQTALAHPWNVWVYFMDHDIGTLAGRLYTSLADAHAFTAGNKRTAFRAAVALIEANGFEFTMPPDARHPIDRLLGYFDGKLGQTGVNEWFRLWMTPR